MEMIENWQYEGESLGPIRFIIIIIEEMNTSARMH